MTEPETDSPENQEPEASRAVVRRRRRWSSVWIIPGVALLLAGWLVWKHFHDQGELALVRFDTANSLVAGKTEVRCRSVKVGIVESLELSTDLRSVVVSLRIDPDSSYLLREGTRFWVVRPRVSGAEISGLNTLIGGAYIELEPGEGTNQVHHYNGLEEPPVTKASVPGLRLTLVAQEAGSLATGSPIYFHGFEVGRVERRSLDLVNQNVRFEVFVDAKYADLVTTGTCFWNTSGIDVSAGADGFKLRTPSFQAMVIGGASFGVPKDGVAGSQVANGAEFSLYQNEGAARDSIFRPDHRCLLFFDQSVRGLKPGAPVEFRGIPMGRVVEISLKNAPAGDPRIPVVIELDSTKLSQGPLSAQPNSQVLADAVRGGLRARLATGSLLTGALYVDLDYIPGAAPEALARSGEYDIIPTQSSGFAQIEARVNAILAKVEALPLEDTLKKFGSAADEVAVTVAEARGALREAEGTLVEARKLLGSDSSQQLTARLDETLKQVRISVESFGPTGTVQGDLHRTLDELRAALRAFKVLSGTIEEKPNSLLFGRDSSGNAIPRARKR